VLNSICHSLADASCELRYMSAISAKPDLINHFLGLYFKHNGLQWSTTIAMSGLACYQITLTI